MTKLYWRAAAWKRAYVFLADLSKIVRRWHITEQLEFFATWSDAFWCQYKPQVGYFGVTKKALGQVDLELVFFQFGQDLIKDL